MSDGVPPIARIRLARSAWRTLALPFLLLAGGGAAVAAGILVAGGLVGLVVAGLGGLLVLVAVLWAMVVLSIHLDVEESAVRVAWLGGGRTYVLTPGPVTRVRFKGDNASRLRRGIGARLFGIGGARLRDEEGIEIVRLAPTATAILVPTERGRLAIAPISDQDLIEALSRAARARRRLDELADAAPAVEPPPTAPEAAPAPEPEAVRAEPDEAPTTLTGIERAQLEQRLADQREADLAAQAAAAAEAERAAASLAVAPAAPAEEPEVISRRRRREAPPRVGRRGQRRPRPGAVLVLLPLLGAGIAWGAGLAMGRIPESGTDLARITSLALVLAGPGTSLGAVMALAFWPRIVGVVVAGGLAASVFVGRALIGG